MAAVLLASIAVVATPGSAGAAPGAFVVDDADDAVDVTPDGSCATATGTCTLRAAVQEAIAHGGTSEIAFAPGASVVALTLAGPGGVEEGDLDIPSGITIVLRGDGSLPGDTMVKADPLGDRHLHVHPGARLELIEVTLAGGHTTGDGGAVLNEGELLVANTTTSDGALVAMTGNRADGVGGAVANRSGALVEIRNVSTDPNGSRVDVSHNHADGGGGAVANDGGTVRIAGGTGDSASHDVYLDNNHTSGDGGGVRNAAGTVTLGCRAFVRHSSAARGGGIENAGTLEIVGGGVDADTATDGGGLHNAAAGTIQVDPPGSCRNTAQISRSTASGSGGALANEGSVVVHADARLLLSGSGGGADALIGGGLRQSSGSVVIEGELEVSQTVASLDGGGLAIEGGSLQVGNDGRITVGSSRSDRDGGAIHVSGGLVSARVALRGNSAGGAGGGLAVTSGGAAVVLDSVLHSNSASVGGAVWSEGTTTLQNSTLGQNSATSSGGAIAHLGGALTARHVSIVSNAPDGVMSTPAAAPSLQLERSLLAWNQGADCVAAARSGGDFNVVDDMTCGPTGADMADPARFGEVGSLLEPMSIGGTDSYGLRPGHPAIDHVTDGGCGMPDRDQLGELRPVDGDGLDGAACDAGAVEARTASPPRSIHGTVRDEVTGLAMQGVCVFATTVSGPDHQTMSLTAADGSFTSAVSDGEYLMAFFVAVGEPSSPDDCGEQGVDLDVRPEWYRNVPVVLEDDDPQGDVVMPDLDDVTLVEVAGADVTGIDACLGVGPGAGRDAPCAPATAGQPDDATPVGAHPSAPSAAPAGEARPAAAAGAALPARLAFTGSSWTVAVLLGLSCFGVGVWFSFLGRRRRRVVPIRVRSARALRRD